MEVQQSLFSRWTISIDNENTQFVRYLSAKSKQENKNLFRVLPGSTKSDGSRIEVQEAEKFNAALPDFFSERYERKNSKNALNSYLMVSSTSLLALFMTAKMY